MEQITHETSSWHYILSFAEDLDWRNNNSLCAQGHLQTRVLVGCPPGLSLVFDAAATQSRSNQFCSPTRNISCYFFGNGQWTPWVLRQFLVIIHSFKREPLRYSFFSAAETFSLFERLTMYVSSNISVCHFYVRMCLCISVPSLIFITSPAIEDAMLS